jgi:hypothetical protein
MPSADPNGAGGCDGSDGSDGAKNGDLDEHPKPTSATLAT